MSGFLAYQTDINTIAQDYGPERMFRLIVGAWFHATLKLVQKDRRDHPRDYARKEYWEATAGEFDAARMQAVSVLSMPREEVIAYAPYGANLIVVTEQFAYLRSPNGYHLTLAGWVESTTYNRDGQPVPNWQIHLHDPGETLAEQAKHFSYGTVKATNAKTCAAAHKSLRKLVETHFKVSLTNGTPA